VTNINSPVPPYPVFQSQRPFLPHSTALDLPLFLLPCGCSKNHPRGRVRKSLFLPFDVFLNFARGAFLLLNLPSVLRSSISAAKLRISELGNSVVPPTASGGPSFFPPTYHVPAPFGPADFDFCHKFSPFFSSDWSTLP